MRRRALLQTAGTLATVALAGCGNVLDDRSSRTTTESRDPSGETPTTTLAPDAESPLDLHDHELVRTNTDSANELVKVVGTLVNRGDSAVEQAAVSASFLDADGTVLDESSADVTDLQHEETWSFELTYSGVGADAREVTDYALSLE